MAHDYYVRTTSGEYRDDRHEFGPKWKGVAAGELSATHFNGPKLEIVAAEFCRAACTGSSPSRTSATC